MTDPTGNSLTPDRGHAPALAGSPALPRISGAGPYGKVSWSWLGEVVTLRAHVLTEREVRDARQRAAQSVVERLSR